MPNGMNIMNCTRHDVRIVKSVLPRPPYDVWNSQTCEGGNVVRAGVEGVIEYYIVKPSGFRLACDARRDGPAYGCQVTYALSEEAEQEIPQILTAFAQLMGVDMAVVASEISVRAANHRLNDGGGGTPVLACWPVLARESLRLPMGDRWCDALATLPLPLST